MSKDGSGVLPNTAEALAFLNRWCPHGPWVLTSIIPDGVTTTKTFALDSVEAMGQWIEERQGKQNLYFHVNPTRRPLDVKASKEDIARLCWLHVDIDPRPGEDHEEERARALKLLQEFTPAPTIIIDSGGGYQGFWELFPDAKLEINGDIARAEELEAYNIQLEKLFGADHCHNVDRIMRIPGTINVPNAKKCKKGRVPVLARLVKSSHEIYPITAFTPAVRVQSSSSDGKLAGGRPKVRITGNVPVVGTEELRAWAKENEKTISDHTLALIATGQDPLDPTKYKSRSETLFKVCCDLVRAGVPDEMIFAVITGPNEIAASVRDKRGWEAYAMRQIERAKEEAIDPWLTRLNDEYAVIGDIGGKCRIIHEVYDFAMKRTRLSKQSFEDFRNFWRNRFVQVGMDKDERPILKPVGVWWLDHPQRRQYHHIVFAPLREVNDDSYNLWQGFACDSLPGNAHLPFLEHVRYNICSGNEEYYNYLVRWMARLVQQPDTPGEVAVVLRGKRGTGKGIFAKTLGALFGRHFLQVSDSKHLVGSFNAHLRDTVLLFGDEAFFAGDKKHEGVLKTLITEENLVIEGKGVDAEAAPNYTHLILASNEEWVVPAGFDERRFFCLDVGDDKKQDHRYFEQLKSSLSETGLENLLHYLMNFDLSDYQVRKVPATQALQEQKMLSMDPLISWFYDKVWEGELFRKDGSWRTGPVLKEAMYRDYLVEMDNRRVQYRLSRNNWSRQVERFCPPNSLKTKQEMMDVPFVNGQGFELVERKRAYVFYFPSLEAMRKHWDNNYGGPHPWPAENASQETFEETGSVKQPF